MKDKKSEAKTINIQANQHIYDELLVRDLGDVDKAFKDNVIQGLREVKLMLNNDKKGLKIS